MGPPPNANLLFHYAKILKPFTTFSSPHKSSGEDEFMTSIGGESNVGSGAKSWIIPEITEMMNSRCNSPLVDKMTELRRSLCCGLMLSSLPSF